MEVSAAIRPKLSSTGTLSSYDMMKYNKLVLTKDAVKAIEEVYA